LRLPPARHQPRAQSRRRSRYPYTTVSIGGQRSTYTWVQATAPFSLTACSRRNDTGWHGTAPDDTGRHVDAGPVPGRSNLGSGARKGVGVQIPPLAPLLTCGSSVRPSRTGGPNGRLAHGPARLMPPLVRVAHLESSFVHQLAALGDHHSDRRSFVFQLPFIHKPRPVIVTIVRAVPGSTRDRA
jgi:hypothetical protein